MKVLPPTLNDLISSARRNRFGDAATKKRWTAKICQAATDQGLYLCTGTVYLEYVWRIKNRRRDQDNITACQKYLLDGLTHAGVLADDNLTIIRGPVVHHFIISDHDGFSIIIRDEESWRVRNQENVSVIPNIDISQLQQEKEDTPTRKLVSRKKRKPYTRKRASRTVRAPRSSSK